MSTDSVSAYIPTPPDGGWGWVSVEMALLIQHSLCLVRFGHHLHSDAAGQRVGLGKCVSVSSYIAQSLSREVWSSPTSRHIPTPPDGGWGWVSVSVALLIEHSLCLVRFGLRLHPDTT